MLPGRVLVIFIGMIWEINSVPAYAKTISSYHRQARLLAGANQSKAGDTVTWINKDIVAHTATVRGGFDVMIEASGSASVVLTKDRYRRVLLPLPSQHEGTDYRHAGVRCRAKPAVISRHLVQRSMIVGALKHLPVFAIAAPRILLNNARGSR